MTVRTLSKSKIMAYRQCPRKLWLEIHRPGLGEDSTGTETLFRLGRTVGELARQHYDPKGIGTTLDTQAIGLTKCLARTRALLRMRRPIFEAGFSTGSASAFLDALLPLRGSQNSWRMVEVKATTKLKDHHRDDTAIQAHVTRSAGVRLKRVALAHLDGDWVYPGGGDYRGLFVEQDLTREVEELEADVRTWVASAHKIAASASEPTAQTGSHCTEPYECGFRDHCQSKEPRSIHPVRWLPSVKRKSLRQLLNDPSVVSMDQVPDKLLDEIQQRVKTHTLAGTTFFDARGAAKALKGHALPAYFLDFETVSFAVPIWKGTRPYQQIPFQFSVHRMSRNGTLDHIPFLDLGGNDPSRSIAKALIEALGARGPIFVYYAKFESQRIAELEARFPDLRPNLRALKARIVDLLPVARKNFYHPSQEGRWGIKAVLPAAFPEDSTLHYDSLEGIADGRAATDAYHEATHPETTADRREQIERQLLAYCRLDTYGLARLFLKLKGHGSRSD